MRPFCHRACSRIYWLVFLLCIVQTAAASEAWQVSAAELAQKVAAKLGTAGPVSVSFKNVAALAPSEFESVRADIHAQLRASRVNVVTPEQAKTTVDIMLSRNAENYLLLAEIKKRAEAAETRADVVIVAVPRHSEGGNGTPVASLVLRSRQLWSQDDPILDLAIIPADSADSAAVAVATVLSPSRVVTFRMQSPQWQEVESVELPVPRVLPRDARGMLVRADDTLEVRLPGVHCRVQGAVGSRKPDCAETSDPWPITPSDAPVVAFFSPSRNFFTGALVATKGGASIGPFFSAVEIGSSEWIVTSTDGRVFASDLQSSATITLPAAGSDVAQLRNNCGGAPIVLATGDGDYTQQDIVQGFHIRNREAVKATTDLDLPGPVTALWSRGEWALAVVHNLSTGRYDAHALSLVCNQ